MGYAGGQQPDPTYRHLGTHAETLQIDFDPARITYQSLLDLFWQSHDPTRSRPRQYRSIIFYHDAEQRRLAEITRDRRAARLGRPILTEIRALQRFYRAEDYHQKYYLRRERDLLQEIQKKYPRSRDMTDATAAARINGYLGGFGSPTALEAEGKQWGLSTAGLRRLRDLYAWRATRP